MIASEYQKLTGYSKFSIFRSLDTQVSVWIGHACVTVMRVRIARVSGYELVLNLVQYILTCTRSYAVVRARSRYNAVLH